MKVSANFDNKTLYLYPTGELDHHGAKKAMTTIESRIDLSLPQHCVLDRRYVTFMDSSGIAVILKTMRLVNEAGGRLVVENVPPQAMRVIDAAGIDRLVQISAPQRSDT